MLLILGIIFNLSLLGYFKYSDFFIQNINVLFNNNYSLLNLTLPLAISFFTFQQIAYLVDNYKGFVDKQSFTNYFVFVTFFPQLIAGPIVHHKEMMPQFSNIFNKSISYQNIYFGILIFLLLNLKIDVSHLNIQIYRARKSISKFSKSLSESLIERRRGEIRLKPCNIVINKDAV